jgi:hypothetical protein
MPGSSREVAVLVADRALVLLNEVDGGYDASSICCGTVPLNGQEGLAMCRACTLLIDPICAVDSLAE